MQHKWNTYADAQGGRWIRVTHDAIIQADAINDLRNELTRMTPDWVYLDAQRGIESDAAVFLVKRRQAGYRDDVDTNSIESSCSSIRKRARYCPAMLNFKFCIGRVVRLNGKLWRIDHVSRKGHGKVFLSEVQAA